MKVILNQDVKHLGEEGDVKVVANGYARNFLLPRNLALPYNEVTVAYFEGRRAEIEARKVEKRKDAAGLKERLESLTLSLVMPAGPNGKLYGAVTNQTLADELQRNGFDIERKRIEVPGTVIKTLGKFHATVRLYEAATAELAIEVISQEEAAKAAESAAKSAEAEQEPVSDSEGVQA